MNARRFDDFLAQTRLNLDPDEHVIFTYDGVPANNKQAIPGTNTELKKLTILQSILQHWEQGIALGNYRTQRLQQALQRNIDTITAAKCGQWFRFIQTYLPRCLNSEAIVG